MTVHSDEIGRLYCDAHRQARCNVCMMDFEKINAQQEQQAGLTREDTAAELLAEDESNLRAGLKFMEGNKDRSSENYNFHVMKLKEIILKKLSMTEAELEQFRVRLEKCDGKKRANYAALSSVASKVAPSSSGGRVEIDDHFLKELEKLEGNLTTGVKGEELGDKLTCSWCRTVARPEKLSKCGRCKKVSYCGKDCQAKAWKGHKKVCVSRSAQAQAQAQGDAPKRKKLSLTWEQLEAYGMGIPADGKFIELQVIVDETLCRGMRQVMGCRDRDGIIKRIACYNDAQSLPGFEIGKTFKWKNPRFHCFMDGSTGARVEEEDVPNISIRSSYS